MIAEGRGQALVIEMTGTVGITTGGVTTGGVTTGGVTGGVTVIVHVLVGGG